MFTVNNIRLGLVLSALLACCTATAAWARPNMRCDHFESPTPNEMECVKQAGSMLTAENAGQLAVDADSVRAWTPRTVAVAECPGFGDKLIVAIWESSEDSAAGNKLFNALRAGMKKQ